MSSLWLVFQLFLCPLEFSDDRSWQQSMKAVNTSKNVSNLCQQHDNTYLATQFDKVTRHINVTCIIIVNIIIVVIIDILQHGISDYCEGDCLFQSLK